MQCIKCGEQDDRNLTIVTETTGKIKKRGTLMALVHLIFAICTMGLWLIIPLLTSGSKGKITSRHFWVCKRCGHKWEVRT